jgi:H+/Cl- antiporter ClcA
VGGFLAGTILLFGQKWSDAGKAADFMEAVVLGNGVIRVRATVVKSLSSLVTICSGGSIGREGPMVQLASMAGSLLGRMRHFSPARRASPVPTTLRSPARFSSRKSSWARSRWSPSGRSSSRP